METQYDKENMSFQLGGNNYVQCFLQFLFVLKSYADEIVPVRFPTQTRMLLIEPLTASLECVQT